MICCAYPSQGRLISFAAGVAGMIISLQQEIGMCGPANVVGLVGTMHWFLCMPAGIIMLVVGLCMWAD
jgi:hypothetical protein